MKKILAAVVFLAAWAAQATMVKPMSVDDLTNAASTVIEGQATDTWASWNPAHSRIYTYTRVKVAQTLKGAPAQTVVVKQMGGSAGGYTQHVSGVHAMETGEDALLFLRPSEAHDGTMVIVGLMQGHFRIARDSNSGTDVASNGVIGVEQVQSGNRKVSSYQGSTLSLKALEQRVRKVAARE